MRISSSDRLLVVAAHPDDEVLGCGGTMAKFAGAGACVIVATFADGVGSRFDGAGVNFESHRLKRRRDMARAHELLGVSSSDLFDFADNRFDNVPLLDLVIKIEGLIKKYSPTIIITHSSSDLNIDHQRLHEACVCACRPVPSSSVRYLLFYEIPSSTDWRPANSTRQFSPSIFIDIGDFIELKLAGLRCYSDEMREFPHSRSYDAVLHLAKYRGATVGVTAAEAFECGRIIA